MNTVGLHTLVLPVNGSLLATTIGDENVITSWPSGKVKHMLRVYASRFRSANGELNLVQTDGALFSA